MQQSNRNDSGISGEHEISPATEGLSPVSMELSPEKNRDLSTNSLNSRYTRI